MCGNGGGGGGGGKIAGGGGEMGVEPGFDTMIEF